MKRRTEEPWPTWIKGVIAISVIIFTTMIAVYGIEGQSQYISVEDALSGKYDGQKVQIHGTVVERTLSKFHLEQNNATLMVEILETEIPATFAENNSATVTGILNKRDDQYVLLSEKIQMGCPSKYVESNG